MDGKIQNFVIGTIIVMVIGVLVYKNWLSENARAKKFGGTQTIELESDTKLINVTWKDSDLWILTRERKQDETIEEYTFSEKLSTGVLEGTIVIKEQ